MPVFSVRSEPIQGPLDRSWRPRQVGILGRSRAITFANNEGWHDDVSDGRVSAEVRFNGTLLEVTPAWVVVRRPTAARSGNRCGRCGPNARHRHQGRNLALSCSPVFSDDILPIFAAWPGCNGSMLALRRARWHGMVDLTSEAALVRLSDNGPAGQELRKAIANQFRHFAVDSYSPVPWPWLYGDAMSIPRPTRRVRMLP